MSVEGGTVACVLNRLGWGFGGQFCLGRTLLPRIFSGRVCLRDVITLWQQNDPPGVKTPSGDRIALRVYLKSPLFGLDR